MGVSECGCVCYYWVPNRPLGLTLSTAFSCQKGRERRSEKETRGQRKKRKIMERRFHRSFGAIRRYQIESATTAAIVA